MPGYLLSTEAKRNNIQSVWKTTKAQYHPVVTKAFKITMLPQTSKSSARKIKTEANAFEETSHKDNLNYIRDSFLERNCLKNSICKNNDKDFPKQSNKLQFPSVLWKENDLIDSDIAQTERSENNLLDCDQQAELECTFQPQEFIVETEDKNLIENDNFFESNIKNSNSKNKKIASEMFKDWD